MSHSSQPKAIAPLIAVLSQVEIIDSARAMRCNTASWPKEKVDARSFSALVILAFRMDQLHCAATYALQLCFSRSIVRLCILDKDYREYRNSAGLISCMVNRLPKGGGSFIHYSE